MLPKHNKEKNVKPKSKNSIIPKNNIIKNTLLSSQIKSNSNSNKSENKFTLKRIKNNSIPNFIEKKIDKKENFKKKINLRNFNSNQITEKQKAYTEKNNKIINRINTEKAQDHLFNIHKLSNFLQNADLKQTIIIDNEGNNNLNLIIDENNKFSDRKLFNNKIDNKNNQKEEKINEVNIINDNFINLFKETTEQKKLLNNNNNINKKKSMGKNSITMNNIKNMNSKNILKKNEEKTEEKDLNNDNKRLDEYSQIFKLLNENIEQFKNILIKKDTNIENKNNNKNRLSSKEGKNTKNTKSIRNKKNLIPYNKTNEEKHIKRNKTNKQKNTSTIKKTMFEDNNNTLLYSQNLSKDKDNSEIYSFLDSFTEDDLFLPFNYKHQKKSSKSLTNIFNLEKKEDNSKKLNKKELEKISTNDMSTNNKCYNDDDIQIEIFGTDEQIKCDTIKNRDINPHFFSNDFVNNINNKEKSNVNFNKECFIF